MNLALSLMKSQRNIVRKPVKTGKKLLYLKWFTHGHEEDEDWINFVSTNEGPGKGMTADSSEFPELNTWRKDDNEIHLLYICFPKFSQRVNMCLCVCVWIYIGESLNVSWIRTARCCAKFLRLWWTPAWAFGGFRSFSFSPALTSGSRSVPLPFSGDFTTRLVAANLDAYIRYDQLIVSVNKFS